MAEAEVAPRLAAEPQLEGVAAAAEPQLEAVAAVTVVDTVVDDGVALVVVGHVVDEHDFVVLFSFSAVLFVGDKIVGGEPDEGQAPFFW